MKRYIYFLLVLFFIQFSNIAFAQSVAPSIVWQKAVGGSGTDVLTAMAIAKDKCILLCGYSNSNVSGNKSNASVGGYDYWVVKLDSSGNVLWNNTYGGSKNDMASAIICTSDGGYLVGGSSISNKSGSKTVDAYGKSFDYWVLKLDANGNSVWDVTMGGISTDRLTSLAELPTGGYLVGGYAYSKNTGSKTVLNLGTESNADYWIVLLKQDGTQLSQNIFGGGGHDALASVVPFGTNSYYAAGYSYSLARSGYKSQNGFGNSDYYLTRYNLTSKKVEYQGDFGGKLSDYLTCMQVLPDSSLIIGGYSNSPASNSKKQGFMGVTDFWLLKLKKDGTKQWDKTIAGGTGDGFGGDYMVSVQQTKDKGFILGGYSNSNIGNNKTENAKGGCDYWIVKVDSLGKVLWNKTIGGSADDKLTAVYEIAPNEFILAGTSGSGQSGDKNSGLVGGTATDYWVLRLGTPASIKKNTSVAKMNSTLPVNGNYSLEVMPNPVKDVLTVQYSTAANSKVDLVIYAANGKVALQSTLTAGSAEGMHSFNVANLPAGSYFAVMYVDGTKITKAFTKE